MHGRVKALDVERQAKLTLFLLSKWEASLDPAKPFGVRFGSVCPGAEIYLSVFVFLAEAFGEDCMFELLIDSPAPQKTLVIK